MAATDDDASRARGGALAALMGSALALPILALPARAGAAEVGEMGLTVLGYKERGLMKVTEPIAWVRSSVGEDWEVAASGAIDIITGASPRVVSNVGGKPVQVLSGASISDRRKTADAKVTRRLGDWSLSVSRARSDEEDYRSRAWGAEAKFDLAQKNTTLAFAYGSSNDRVRSVDDPTLDERRDTREYLAGVTQVLSPTALVQATVVATRGAGRYSDPYKFTITRYPDGGVTVLPDLRPAERDTWAAHLKYRRHMAGLRGTLQVDYRYFRDDWGVQAHTVEAAWEQALGERWSLRPALRYYTQSAADFYSAEIPRPRPQLQSSDQRLGAFGGLTPSLRATLRLEGGPVVEGTVGYVHDAASLRPGGGSPAFETLRAVFGTIGVTWGF